MATSQSAADSPKPAFTISSAHDGITSIAWLPGDRLVTGSFDRTVWMWNSTDGTQEGRSMVHDYEVLSIVATKDGRIVSCCREGDHLRVWNADTQELVERPQSDQDNVHPRGITLSQNEELLASDHWTWFVFWEMAGTMRVRTYIRIADRRNLTAPYLSPNGLRFAVFCHGGFSVFNVETGERIFRLPDEKEIRGCSWSFDGGRLFCGNNQGQFHCFNSNTGESVGKPWTGNTQITSCMSLSPDGRWLASGSHDRTVRFWDAETGKPVGGLLPHESAVAMIAFSRTGEFIASACHILYSSTYAIFIWRVPWWHDRNQKASNALLDMSVVVSPDASGPSNIPDLGIPDTSSPCHPLPPQTHSRENSSSDPPRVQDSVRSWQWWKRIPRLIFLRSHPIYTAPVPPRIYVSSWEDVDNSQRSQSLSSSEENSESSSDTPPAGLEPEVGELEVGCCGFLSRWQPGVTAAQGQQHVRSASERSSRSDRPPTSENPGILIPIPATMHAATQDILELSAVVRSSDTS